MRMFYCQKHRLSCFVMCICHVFFGVVCRIMAGTGLVWQILGGTG